VTTTKRLLRLVAVGSAALAATVLLMSAGQKWRPLP
jgi:hypothetical protein